MKWDKLKQAIKDSKDNPDFDIWDFLADELGLDPNGKSDSDDEEEVEWSADRFGGDKCGFCNEPNDGLWIEGQEDAVCEKCSQVWEYDADTDSYHKIKKDQTN